MVPMRAIFEWLGAEVVWDEPTNTVYVEEGEMVGTMIVERPVRSAMSPAARKTTAKRVRVSDGRGGYWDFYGTCDPGMIKNSDLSGHPTEITVSNLNGVVEGTWKKATGPKK